MDKISVDEMSLRFREVAYAEPTITCGVQIACNKTTHEITANITLHGEPDAIKAALAFLHSGAKAGPGYT